VLYDKYKSRGFVVLGFPCNQFGNQEPHDESTIKQMVAEKYGVTYPLFSKVDVNGPGTHPIFQFLKSFDTMGEDIGWNFVKFLVDRSGKPVKRYATTTNPMTFESDIVELLG